jgi:hypothetical protein
MMLETAVLTLKTDRPVQETAVNLRGFIGTKFQDYAILHHHMDGGNLYTYPKVQYKVVKGTPFIVGIEEGTQVLKDISGHIKKLELGKNIYAVVGRQINEQDMEIIATRKEYKYQFLTPWLALNQKNHIRYRDIGDWRERKLFLNNILVGNILSMCKGLGIIVNRYLHVRSHLTEERSKFKSINSMSFTGEFIINFKIPDFFGIGKSSSHGYGTVKNIPFIE